MKIGYYVQGDTDEAVIWGLAQRWCPDAELAPGKFRGTSGDSLQTGDFQIITGSEIRRV